MGVVSPALVDPYADILVLGVSLYIGRLPILSLIIFSQVFRFVESPQLAKAAILLHFIASAPPSFTSHLISFLS